MSRNHPETSLGAWAPSLRGSAMLRAPPFVARLADSQGERAEGALEDFHEPGLEVEATKFLSLSQGKARRHDICGWSGSAGRFPVLFLPFLLGMCKDSLPSSR